MNLNEFQIIQIINMLPLEKLKDNGNYYSACCPFHGESNPSFGVHKNGYYNCLACNEKGSINKLVKYLLNTTVEKLLNISDINSYNFINSFQKIEKKRDSFEVKETNLIGNLYSVYDNKKVLDFLYSKNVSDDFIKDFNIKYCTYIKINNTSFRDRIIIPIKYFDKIVGYEGRDFTKQQRPKVLYNKGSKVDFLFNFSNLDKNKPLYITEGMLKSSILYTNISKNTTHTFGAKITKLQINQLNQFKEKIFFIDMDESGRNSLLKLDEELNDDFYIAHSKIEDQDPADMTLEEVRNALSLKELNINYFLDKSLLFENKLFDWSNL